MLMLFDWLGISWQLLNFKLWIEYFVLIECGILFAMFWKDQFEKPYVNEGKKHLGTLGQPIMGFFASVLFQAAGIPLYEAMTWSTGLFTAANLTPSVLRKTGAWLDAKRETSLEDRDVRLVKCLGKMMNVDEQKLQCILKEAGLIDAGKKSDEKITPDELAKAALALTSRDDSDCPFKDQAIEETVLEEILAEDGPSSPLEAS